MQSQTFTTVKRERVQTAKVVYSTQGYKIGRRLPLLTHKPLISFVRTPSVSQRVYK